MNLTPEDRDDLATQALLAERRNRPRGLVVLCGLITSIAMVVLLFSLISLGGAQRAQASDLKLLKEIQDLKVKLDDFESSANAGLGGDLVPIPGILTLIEQKAEQAGLDKPPIPQTSRPGQGAIRETRRKYQTIHENDIEKVMKWIDSVVSDIPGVFVQQLRIAPQASDWTVNITFSRWERES